MGKGTGLGLATVYGVVKQSDGYVWVDSEVGREHRSKFFSPMVDEESGGEVIAKTPKDEVKKGSETVLLVEDSEPLMKVTKLFLETHGFRVLTAQDGEGALRSADLHSGSIHLLLTDVVMPGINGRVLAERLVTKRPTIKVLFMSGYTDSFVAVHGVLDPGMALLNKPFTEEELMRKFERCCIEGISKASRTALQP